MKRHGASYRSTENFRNPYYLVSRLYRSLFPAEALHLQRIEWIADRLKPSTSQTFRKSFAGRFHRTLILRLLFRRCANVWQNRSETGSIRRFAGLKCTPRERVSVWLARNTALHIQGWLWVLVFVKVTATSSFSRLCSWYFRVNQLGGLGGRASLTYLISPDLVFDECR